jgi:LPS-assembly lipoprotein
MIRPGQGRRIARRHLVAMLPVVALPWSIAGCGFRPVYARRSGGDAGPAAEGLAAVAVGPIPERTGQLLRLALRERLERSGLSAPQRYDLSVAFRIDVEGGAILPDSSVTRLRFTGSADWTLTARDAQRRTLTSGNARVVDGQNLFDSQTFAADLETETVQRRIAEAVADQIALRLAAYFVQSSATG